MNIITYRGPGMPGGLSNSVAQAWHTYAYACDRWWNVGNDSLQCLAAGADNPCDFTPLLKDLIEGHYRYCNEFLWPLLHNLPDLSVFRYQSNRQYELFNLAIAQALGEAFEKGKLLQTTFFIHDYHFALLPYFLKRQLNAKSVFFWHIPWPTQIEDPTIISQLKNIVLGLLYCEAVGFHTNEYAINFMQFVEDNLPDYRCNWDAMSIMHRDRSEEVTSVMVAPLGIDYNSWHALAEQKTDPHYNFKQMPYIFSVDRTDYTKGVTNRLEAIDYFFERFPRWQQKVTFVQSCGRTRAGLPAFDKYWDDCHFLYARLNKNWTTNDWRPLIWLDENLPVDKLAKLYSDASVMLVNPIRDGLNLTAKEYVACQITNPGALILSPGAGVWDELGNYCVAIDPHDHKAMAESINRALCLSPGEKSMRMNLLRAAVQKNSLMAWWFSFRDKLDSHAGQKVVDIRAKLSIINASKR